MHRDIFLMNKHFTDLNPRLAGSEDCERAHSYGPATRDHYLIHYVVSGCGTFYTERGSYHVGKGEIFIIRPHEITTYTADKTDPWYYIWIGFDGNLAKKLDQLPSPVIPYRENTFFELLRCNEMSNMREEFAASKLFEIISYIFNDNSSVTRYERLAYDYILSNYMRPIRIEELAGHLGINRQYLSRLFKAAYGTSMQELLVSTRLHHAENLLKDGHSVAEAAYMVGYDDVFNFSKMFKKQFGISPRNLKKAD